MVPESSDLVVDHVVICGVGGTLGGVIASCRSRMWLSHDRGVEVRVVDVGGDGR